MIKPDLEQQRLPEHLAAKLPAELRDALQHPFRRRILRAFREDAQRLNPVELATSGQVPCSAACVNYHMLTLSTSGLVKEERSEPAGGSLKRYFSSSVGDRKLVFTVLQDTEESDNRFLAQSAAG
jgi:hypothetical protein